MCADLLVDMTYYERLALVDAISAFAHKYGWAETQEVLEAELENKIQKCAECGVLTDEYNEDERRHVHAECLGAWRGASVPEVDDLQDCA